MRGVVDSHASCGALGGAWLRPIGNSGAETYGGK
jgi:hypothetical protein